MKLGYIHSNREEQTRVMQVLKMTSESVALDELGIGSIRDAFADRMFPGISTLQKHMKYFSLVQGYGIQLADGPLRGLTARAVIVIDENGKVRYTQLVKEVSNEPDYEAALQAANEL